MKGITFPIMRMANSVMKAIMASIKAIPLMGRNKGNGTCMMKTGRLRTVRSHIRMELGLSRMSFLPLTEYGDSEIIWY